MNARPDAGTGSRGDLLAALARVLPADALLHERADLKPYECDGLTAFRSLPLAVALPRTVAQIEAVLRTCAQHRVPVVARGAGTGLSGGALPLADGVVLGLARLNRILEIDPRNRLARVQPGVTNLAISQAAAPYGLFYAPDPSSQIACTIGGNVAENAGGLHCLKYGLTTHNLLKIDVITIDGERLTFGSDALDAPGYDLLALMTGSEGLLGVVVEVTVKLLPKPQDARLLLAAFASVDAAANAVARIIRAGLVPGGLEMMDRPAIAAVEAYAPCGYPADAQAVLLCELDGVDAEVLEEAAHAEAILREAGADSVRVAVSAEERAAVWSGRKAAFPALGRLAPDYYCIDGSIPRGRLPDVLRGIAALSREYGLAVANVFHAGDGNLHPIILYDAADAGARDRTERLGTAILALCVEAGGSVTGEHGVGVEKLDAMCAQFLAPEIEQFHRIKHAFDPHGLLNPGKAVPTPRRCAEFGRMHVHRGALPFAHLERY
ncbi:FAD-linked oxidase C-terminal domain-containing protein [Dokdonella ginsengisoli]|uniref:FAD-linked oxidase C-terminal domain-containing protein n=1 Tax=Dokdonella ginsengisoli TaxID=363846 RepID=A0ABV9QZN1_9GAMM